ncbi:MAG: hypothetical protein U0871_12020 [Gemmataceae bacterium]
MTSHIARDGQTEIGLVVGPTGRPFAALGASVRGRHVTGYTSARGELTTWDGRVMLACRSESVRRFRDGAEAVVYRLTGGRFIAGYSLGTGMLFRGELVTADDGRTGAEVAEQLAGHWREADADDERDWDGAFANDEADGLCDWPGAD